MRSTAAAICICLAGIAIAQDTATPVTVTIRAARLPTVLQELSRASKLTLEAAPAALIPCDVLAIRVSEMPIGEVMKRVATVTACTWRQTNGVYRLMPDSALRRKQAQSEAQKKVASFEKDLKEKVDSIRKADAAAKQAASGAKATKDAPSQEMGMPHDDGERAIVQLLLSLNRTGIANMSKGDRTVYSTNPTHMQLALPGTASQIVQQYVVAHNANNVYAGMAPDALFDGAEKVPQYIRDMMKRQTSKITNATKALLIVSRQSLMDQIVCELRVYDGKGVTVASETQSFGNSEMMMGGLQAATAGDAPKGAAAAPATSTPIELSDDSKAFAKLDLSSMTSGTFKIEPALFEKLGRPDITDPLSFSDTDALFSVAKALKLPLVANIPDTSMSLFGFGGEKSTTIESEIASLEKDGPMQRLTDPGWLSVQPRTPEQARAVRLNRVAMATLVQAGRTRGSVSLDEMSTFALSVDDPMDGGLAMLYTLLFVPGSMSPSMMMGTSNWSMLRFYGSLSGPERQAVQRGGRMSFAFMQPSQLALVSRMVFGADGHLEVVRAGEKPAEDDYFGRITSMFVGGGSGGRDYLEEPTEVLPDGLRNDGFLQASSKVEPIGSLVPADGATSAAMMTNLGLDELAMFKMMSNEPAVAGSMPRLDRLRVGSRDVLSFKFHFTPVVGFSQTLVDNHISPNGKIVSMTNLPADFSQALDARVEKMKKSPFGSAGFGGLGRGAKPPP